MSKESAHFGWGEVREYDPTHNGIRWRELLEQRAEAYGVELPAPMWYETDRGDQFELHEDNCFVFMSHADDTLDCIRVEYPDGEYRIFWREDFGTERFDHMVSSVGYIATHILRPTPAKGLQDAYEAEHMADVRNAEFLPKEWTMLED